MSGENRDIYFGSKESFDYIQEQFQEELVKEETLRKHLISENKNNGENYKIPKSTIKKEGLKIGSYKYRTNKFK